MQNLKPNTIVKKLSFDDLPVINDLVSICKSLCITNRLLEQGTKESSSGFLVLPSDFTHNAQFKTSI